MLIWLDHVERAYEHDLNDSKQDYLPLHAVVFYIILQIHWCVVACSFFFSTIVWLIMNAVLEKRQCCTHQQSLCLCVHLGCNCCCFHLLPNSILHQLMNCVKFFFFQQVTKLWFRPLQCYAFPAVSSIKPAGHFN